MIADLGQDEHLVGLEAKEVRWVVEVRIGEPGVRAIAVGERAFDVGHDLGLGALRGSHGVREIFALGVGAQNVGDISHMRYDLAKRAVSAT